MSSRQSRIYEVLKTVLYMYFNKSSKKWDFKETQVYLYCYGFFVRYLSLKDLEILLEYMGKYNENLINRIKSIRSQSVRDQPKPKQYFSRWTESIEDEFFAGIIKFGYNWEKISELFENLSAIRAECHWENICDKNKRFIRWSFQENEMFLKLIKEQYLNLTENRHMDFIKREPFFLYDFYRHFGFPNFRNIASELKSKNAGKCRLHFFQLMEKEITIPDDFTITRTMNFNLFYNSSHTYYPYLELNQSEILSNHSTQMNLPSQPTVLFEWNPDITMDGDISTLMKTLDSF